MNQPRNCFGFTLIELLVTIAIVGVLIGMLLPAVQLIRARAQQNSCLNNLRQLGMAVQNFESGRGYFPPAARLGEGTGWHAYLLPHVEQDVLYDRIVLTDPNQNFDWSSDGEEVMETLVSLFRCPSDPAPDFIPSPGVDERAVSSYLACASGTVPNAAEDLRSGRLELKILESGDKSKMQLVREMRSGAMPPTQTFIDHPTLNAPYPDF
ncbi:MAG: DUF1559 domain-containing protein, partial [Planctomycetota bacterium]